MKPILVLDIIDEAADKLKDIIPPACSYSLTIETESPNMINSEFSESSRLIF